jgi:hypothetical protein
MPAPTVAGYTEVEKRGSGFDLCTTVWEVENYLLTEIKPVFGASGPTVYVHTVAQFSKNTEQQFIAQK